MPGTINGGAAVGTLPFSLSTKFTASLSFAGLANEYHDGSAQRSSLVSESRRSWRLAKRLTPTELATLRDFFEAHPADAFYFYDPKETSPIYSYDPTGVETDGRYLVRFASDWTQTIGMSRGDAEIEIVEVASSSGTITTPPEAPPLITTAEISVWCAYLNNSTVGRGAAGLSYNGGISWTGNYLGSGLAGIPVGTFTRQQITAEIDAPRAIAGFQARVYCVGTLFSSGPEDTFSVYDISLTVTYSDASTQTLRPSSFQVEDNSTGDADDAELAWDGDITTTFAAVKRTFFNGLTDPTYLIFTGWH